jgi:hypothetical protein
VTTLAEARGDLVAAIAALDIRASVVPTGAPPYVAVLGDGIDLSHIVRGQALASFRLACVAGGVDDDAVALELDTLKLAMIAMLRTLEGWRPGEVRRDGVRTINGADMLSADVTASRYVDMEAP